MSPVRSDLETAAGLEIRAGQYQKLVNKFVSYFKSQNSSFDKKKFLKAIKG